MEQIHKEKNICNTQAYMRGLVKAAEVKKKRENPQQRF